ncbi:hypothetical protein chiPu_0025193, partial [Chiloscyllium punctatum]|nr:hypothetical protein [Chiloscyllium punctatum]
PSNVGAVIEQYHPVWSLQLHPELPQTLRHSGTHAGADGKAQELQAESSGLPEDLPVPEVAADGGTSR